MRIISWNIQMGGGKRHRQIVDAVLSHDPDVMALSEFRANSGARLSSVFASNGWRYLQSTNPVGREHGLCVISRTPMVRGTRCLVPQESCLRWLEVEFPEYGFGVGVVHIPCSTQKRKSRMQDEPKARFWDAILRSAEGRLDERCLFIGDFNTGAHGVDEQGKTFVCAEHFAKLSSLRWTDAWRQHNPDTTEWTWYSRRKGGVRGNGFRLDHAFATPTLKPRLSACRYSHEERERGASDHSVLVLDIE